MRSKLRLLDSNISQTEDSLSSLDVIQFLSSIYDAKRFSLSAKDESNYLLSFDSPSFSIFLLDSFTKMRFDRRLHKLNYLVVNVPLELSLLTKVDVATSIDQNWMNIRFHLSGQFITVRFEMITSTAEDMRTLLDDIHQSFQNTAISFVCDPEIGERNTNRIKTQIDNNRVYKVLSCSNGNESQMKLRNFDKDLCLLQGVTCG